jgi:hypothetical protein
MISARSTSPRPRAFGRRRAGSGRWSMTARL